jgi:hypothetical protein
LAGKEFVMLTQSVEHKTDVMLAAKMRGQVELDRIAPDLSGAHQWLRRT